MKNFSLELRHGSGLMMTIDPTSLLIAFKKPQTQKEIVLLLREVGLVIEDA